MPRIPLKKASSQTRSAPRSSRRRQTADLGLALDVLQRQPSKPDLKRATILTAVVEIIAEQGVDELTFERIGRRVKMARSHVVYYFSNREELVNAAIQLAATSANQTIEKFLEEGETWREKLEQYVLGNFAWITTEPAHATVYALLYYLATFKPEYRALHSQIRETGAARIRSILSHGPMGKDPKQVAYYAKAIQGLITGNVVDIMSTDQSSQAEKRTGETLRAIEELLGGI